jgi:hypothetical protein
LGAVWSAQAWGSASVWRVKGRESANEASTTDSNNLNRREVQSPPSRDQSRCRSAATAHLRSPGGGRAHPAVSIGRTADLYNDVRQLRLSMEKEVEQVKKRETELREYIIANLSKSDDTGAAGLRYRAQIVSKDVPRAMDWSKVHAFIQKSGRFDLLQKRLGEKAVMDMVADGRPSPAWRW